MDGEVVVNNNKAGKSTSLQRRDRVVLLLCIVVSFLLYFFAESQICHLDEESVVHAAVFGDFNSATVGFPFSIMSVERVQY
jgi:hypothetical protein